MGIAGLWRKMALQGDAIIRWSFYLKIGWKNVNRVRPLVTSRGTAVATTFTMMRYEGNQGYWSRIRIVFRSKNTVEGQLYNDRVCLHDCRGVVVKGVRKSAPPLFFNSGVPTICDQAVQYDTNVIIYRNGILPKAGLGLQIWYLLTGL